MKLTSKLFSFKKFIAVGLSFVMFFQYSSLSFASDDVQLTEDSNQRIVTQHKNGKYYVATFDKNTKILVQNTYIDGTNELIDTVKRDLNVKRSTNILKKSSCYTTCGYSYLDDKDVTCSRPGNECKVILDGISDRSQFDRARNFESEVSSLRGSEERIAASALLVLVALLVPSGVILEISEAMLKAAGISEAYWELCFQIREKCRNCDIAYNNI